MARAFGITAEEQLTCGCHVHVGISSADEAVAVLDRIRPWLAVLLALSANSPFWQGRDTSYASFRYQAWGRWPTAGPTEVFLTVEAYRQTVRQMVGTGTLLDSGMVYFDARLSEHYPTLEVRIADVCLHADDAVLIAALCRARVDTEARSWQAVPTCRDSVPRCCGSPRGGPAAPGWTTPCSIPLGPARRGGDCNQGAADDVRDALDEAATRRRQRPAAEVLAGGDGAAFQRSAYGGDGSMSEMIDSAAAATIR